MLFFLEDWRIINTLIWCSIFILYYLLKNISDIYTLQDEAIFNAMLVYYDTSHWVWDVKNISYTQRYSQCSFLFRHMSVEERRAYYSQVEILHPKELVIFRVSPQEPWGDNDFLLAACSFAVEPKRRVIFHIEESSRESIPQEFRDLVITFNSDNIRSEIPWFDDAKMHGDVVVSKLLQEYKEYDKAWVFEGDVRLAGHWDTFLSSTTPHDLYLWQGKLVASGRENPHWWVNPRHYHGLWSAPNLPEIAGEWTMGFGISYHFAVRLLDLYTKGTYNDNQEVNMPTVISVSKKMTMKVDDNQGRLAWECCDLGHGQATYDQWLSGERKELPAPFLIHPVKRKN